MLIHGGSNGTHALASGWYLDVETHAWAHAQIDGRVARTRHGAVHASFAQTDPEQSWATSAYSVVVIFGGLGADG
jgi:hypothetical protein